MKINTVLAKENTVLMKENKVLMKETLTDEGNHRIDEGKHSIDKGTVYTIGEKGTPPPWSIHDYTVCTNYWHPPALYTQAKNVIKKVSVGQWYTV